MIYRACHFVCSVCLYRLKVVTSLKWKRGSDLLSPQLESQLLHLVGGLKLLALFSSPAPLRSLFVLKIEQLVGRRLRSVM